MRSGSYNYFSIGNRVGGMGCVVDSFRVLDRQLASASRGKSDKTLQSYRFLVMGPYIIMDHMSLSTPRILKVICNAL